MRDRTADRGPRTTDPESSVPRPKYRISLRVLERLIQQIPINQPVIRSRLDQVRASIGGFRELRWDEVGRWDALGLEARDREVVTVVRVISVTMRRFISTASYPRGI